jgi:hypothetical protein
MTLCEASSPRPASTRHGILGQRTADLTAVRLAAGVARRSDGWMRDHGTAITRGVGLHCEFASGIESLAHSGKPSLLRGSYRPESPRIGPRFPPTVAAGISAEEHL